MNQSGGNGQGRRGSFCAVCQFWISSLLYKYNQKGCEGAITPELREEICLWQKVEPFGHAP